MAITVEKMYRSLRKKFHIEIVAGMSGDRKLVQWLSNIDNCEVIPYMRQRELAILTGYIKKTDEELLEICKQLHEERHTCGLLLNIGPYINHVSETIITYCEENEFPLLTFPWKVRIIDLINESTKLILKSDTKEENINEIFKNLLFTKTISQGNRDLLARNGFHKNQKYSMLIFELNHKQNMEIRHSFIEQVKIEVERMIAWRSNKYVIIKNFNQIIVFLIEKTEEEIRIITKEMFEDLENRYLKYQTLVLVGPFQMEFEFIALYYHKMKIAGTLVKKKNRYVTCYDDMGIDKIFLEALAAPGEVLKDYYDRGLGVLEEYDAMNDTKMVAFLIKYFEEQGNIKELAKKQFVHRNTITYNLKKIEAITGYHINDWNDRFTLQLCIYIKDII